MFEGFEKHRIAVGDADIFTLTAGAGPPLLLLHGFPQNHAMWHKVAPSLSRHFSLVIADLRGYGESTGPRPDPDHRAYSKRAMAADMVGLMAALGYERFALAGHDRGGRVGYRLALDHPERITRLAALDIVPTFDVWRTMDADQAMRLYHWQFLAQPAPMPERLIGQDPNLYLMHLLDRWTGLKGSLDAEAVAEYARAFRRATVVEAACEDYRAGATIDRELDRADREKYSKPVRRAAAVDRLGHELDVPASLGSPRRVAHVGDGCAGGGARVRPFRSRGASRGMRRGAAGILCRP